MMRQAPKSLGEAAFKPSAPVLLTVLQHNPQVGIGKAAPAERAGALRTGVGALWVSLTMHQYKGANTANAHLAYQCLLMA